ncbi:MAG TPA: flavin reductase family protein [Candidatus Nitrosotalea sp.]|nr:flavin reductase family protein [Candidatus Nitrosotalea sp.]
MTNKSLARNTPSKAERYFSTGISMITSNGPQGPNVMAAEWVMQISYSPVLVAIFIHHGSHTIKNIEKTKEFGINVASKEQTTEISVAGGYSGSEIDKLKIKNIFKISKPHKIKTPMISDCTINAECKLVRKEKLGDHVMFVGKVVHMKHDDTKSPLIYHKGRYFSLDSTIEPDRKEVLASKKALEFFKNIAQERFVLKCVGVLAESKNKILVTKWPEAGFETIPITIPPPGVNQKDHLVKHLKNTKLPIKIRKDPIMKRLVLKNGTEIQRINFILYKGKMSGVTGAHSWASKDDEIISHLI